MSVEVCDWMVPNRAEGVHARTISREVSQVEDRPTINPQLWNQRSAVGGLVARSRLVQRTQAYFGIGEGSADSSDAQTKKSIFETALAFVCVVAFVLAVTTSNGAVRIVATALVAAALVALVITRTIARHSGHVG